MAGILDRFPQWRKYWGLIQDAARRWGMNPNETLATHVFENTAANPDAASHVGALGLAQIFDKRVSSSTNPKGWAQFAKRWGFSGSSDDLPESMKRDPAFAIDYLAWRMAGSRHRYQTLDAWYRSGGYNPGFKGDSRGPGPSIYVTDNPRSRSQSGGGIPFPVAGSDWSYTDHWGSPRDGGARQHKGVDIGAARGTPLIAVADGKIDLRTGGAGGNAVWINGTYYYAHLSRFNVTQGQRVKKGDIIGYVGSTGTSSTGPHLHLGIDPKGTFGQNFTDPFKFLESAEVGHGGVEFDVFDSGDPTFNPTPDPYDVFFPQESGGIPLPGGGPGLPGGGPGLPGTGFQGLQFQRRDMSSTWQLIANQEDASPDTLRIAGLGEEPA